MTCPTASEMVGERINRVLTQYRESPKLLHVLRTYLGAAAQAHLQVCDLPSYFDLDTAIGDQLTLLGKRMGWPRCHCVCDVSPVFGFSCVGINLRPVTGFCDETGSWVNCDTGLSEICLSDDELYRKFLKVRRYQFLQRYDLPSMEACVKIFFGPTATVLHSGQGRIVVAPGRDLTDTEIALLQLYPRVLPSPLGISVVFHFGPLRVFGFGDGWGGLMEESQDLTDENIAYQRTGKVFGFCDGAGGFCEEWEPNGLPLGTGVPGQVLVDDLGQILYTGPLTSDAAWMCREGAAWMCEVDVRPYSC